MMTSSVVSSLRCENVVKKVYSQIVKTIQVFLLLYHVKFTDFKIFTQKFPFVANFFYDGVGKTYEREIKARSDFSNRFDDIG